MSEARRKFLESLYGPRLEIASGKEPVAGYVLEEPIGQNVWRAKGPGDQAFAMKFVSKSSAMAQGELNSFPLISNLKHANVLRLFHASEVMDKIVVVMEIADGDLQSLKDDYEKKKRQKGIPRAELLGYVSEAATGLDFLNTKQHDDGKKGTLSIAHCDIRAGNLLLKDGHVKIADFGITVPFADEPGEHTGIESFATSPEGSKGQVYRSSDQYSLAAVYYYLLTGEIDYADGTLKGLNGQEQEVVRRALAGKPADRWASCTELVQTLQAI